MSIFKQVTQVLLLALIAPYLYDRYIALSPMVANRPGKFQNLRTFQDYEIKYQDQLRNCEDVILEKSLGIAFLSCDPGRDRWNTVMGTFHPALNPSDHGSIYIYNYSSTSPTPPRPLPIDELDLHPLGLAYDASSSTLYIANHPRHKPAHILILHLDLPSLTTTLVARLTHPLLHAPNAIHVLGRGKLYVTNDHYLRAAVSPLGSKLETFSGLAGGTVVYIDTRRPRSARIVARVPFANGIASVNASTVAVASSSKAGIYLFERTVGEGLLLRRVVRTPTAVDNLSADGEGVVVAGHPFAPALMGVARGRVACAGVGGEGACGCGAPSWVAEWSEKGGLRELYKDDGGEFCSSSTVVRDGGRGVGIVSGLYERGILVFRT